MHRVAPHRIPIWYRYVSDKEKVPSKREPVLFIEIKTLKIHRNERVIRKILKLP
jgi:hypothetical protein